MVNEDEISVFVVREVDVVARPLHEEPPQTANLAKRVGWCGVGCGLNHLQGRDELFAEQIRR